MSSDFDGSNFISNAHGALRRQQQGGLDATFDRAITTSTKTKRKRESSLRKAPGAPKRFKSSYILFFMAQREEIKRELGSKASVGEISKRSSEKWRRLTPEDKKIWEEKAAADKQRYKLEKAQYTGPWQIPWKRAKKDPDAPKRPMSAFLYYSQQKRSLIKQQNPGLKNTEISRVLGQMWKNAAPEERTPHIDHEKAEREKYKAQMALWREKEEERKNQITVKSEDALQQYNSRPKIMHEERPEPIPYPEPIVQVPVQNDEHYGQYNNEIYSHSGYYQHPNYNYGDNGQVHYSNPQYQNWNNYHNTDEERQGYYNDDYKPLPYDQNHSEERYTHDTGPVHTYAAESQQSQQYIIDHQQRLAPPQISSSFDAEDDFGMQAPF